jgi:hypothetical protein
MKTFLTYALILGLVISPSSPVLGGLLGSGVVRAAQTSPTTSTKAPVVKTSATAPVDGGWPREYGTASGGRLVIYEPQVESWPDQQHIVLYAAVASIGNGAQKPTLGTIKVEADTKVSVDDRLVNFSAFTITSSNFPTLGREEVGKLIADIHAAVPLNERVIALDRVMAAVDTSQIKPKNIEGVKADPPIVFFSQTPAVLVNLDGEPIWSPIPNNELRFAVNTNWDLFEYPPSKSYYLRVDKSWMKAPSVKGPWTVQSDVPASFAKLPDDENWKDVKAALPARASTAVPAVFISTKPAELILLAGPPKYVPVKGTSLQWVSNTDSDLFRAGTDGLIYFLVSGRWFSSPSFSGPWTFATVNLPDDFKRIPLEHERSRVLASVPGSPQAIEAVVLAEVPQTARVSRQQAKAPDVSYQGEPVFQPIENTGVARAVNTDKDIIKVGDLYYLCFDGVWFMGRDPNGPWTVADSVPQSIYEIPISSPAHNVTYVTVEDSNDDYVEFATAAAYTGMMVAWGCAVWGSGYYYPPYFWGGGAYPVYYPRYPSYGYGARYNPWTGAYTRGGVAYGPYGGAGYAARYNPTTGNYSRAAAAYGPGGARGAAEAWNPRTGTSAQTRQGRNVYGGWGSTAVTRGDQWAATSRYTSRATGATTRATTGSGGGANLTHSGALGRSTVGVTGSGNVYAGRDGNVYRNDGGSWQKYGNGGWSSLDRPVGTSGQLGSQYGAGLSSATRDQLSHDRSARLEGAQRTRDLSTVRSSSGAGRSSSYRPSGGGFSRGGGGMRGGGGRR